MGRGPIAWKKELEVGKITIRPHFTKIERRKDSGLYIYHLAPRIGLDFLEEENTQPTWYLPNLDIGDVLRFVEVLQLVQRRSVYRMLRDRSMDPFEIALTFRRKLTVDVDNKRHSLVLMYYVARARHPLFKIKVPIDAVDDLADMFRSLALAYIAILRWWLRGQKIPRAYVQTLGS